ncbi:MAG TPA: DsrE family protein [Sediminispirochaeta sp.]|nr:DsrE family protein [Sediminispirochaeta sp.]
MNEKLVVLWTSSDIGTAKNMVFMYTLNAKKRGWFEEVTFIVWGSSAGLLAEDEELQEILKEMIRQGVKVEACLRCAENYGVVDTLKDLGIEVKLMGEPLSDYLKEGCKVLSV